MDDIIADLLLKAIQQSHQPIAILSRKGKITWTNDGFNALAGYKSEELVGLSLTDIFKDSENIQFLSEEKHVFNEVYMSRKDGPDLCLEVRFSPVADKQNKASHFILEVAEIKERDKPEEKFKEQLEQYRQIISSLNEGYILVDEHGDIHDVNPAYCDMVGYTRDELLSMKIEDLRKEMTGEYRYNFIQSVREEGGKKFRTRHHRKDGSIVNLEATASIIEKNDTTYLAGFVWDISDRLKAEQQLEESEERWQQLVNNNSLPIIISKNGFIKFVNQAALDLYGAEDKEQVLGKSILNFIPDESKNEVEGL
ncbi:MAG: PAS domain-containing protein, partial [Candidatus Cyclobacteriaceae bacterium M2_1C_046]